MAGGCAAAIASVACGATGFTCQGTAGLDAAAAAALLRATTLHGNVPEPLRLAHLIAGGVTTGASRGRA